LQRFQTGVARELGSDLVAHRDCTLQSCLTPVDQGTDGNSLVVLLEQVFQ
jgi:hypothetical protein